MPHLNHCPKHLIYIVLLACGVAACQEAKKPSNATGSSLTNNERSPAPVNVTMEVDQSNKEGGLPAFTLTFTNKGTEAARGLRLRSEITEAKDKDGDEVEVGLRYQRANKEMSIGTPKGKFPISDLPPNDSRTATLSPNNKKPIQSCTICVTLLDAAGQALGPAQELKWSIGGEVLKQGDIALKIEPSTSIAGTFMDKFTLALGIKIDNNVAFCATHNHMVMHLTVLSDACPTEDKTLNTGSLLPFSASPNETTPLTVPLEELAQKALSELVAAGFTVKLTAHNTDGESLASIEQKVEVLTKDPAQGDIALSIDEAALITRDDEGKVVIKLTSTTTNKLDDSILDFNNVNMLWSVAAAGNPLNLDNECTTLQEPYLGPKHSICSHCSTTKSTRTYTTEQVWQMVLQGVQLTATCTLQHKDGKVLAQAEQPNIRLKWE